MAVAFVSATNNGSGSTNFSVTVPAGSDRYMKVGIVWWGSRGLYGNCNC